MEHPQTRDLMDMAFALAAKAMTRYRLPERDREDVESAALYGVAMAMKEYDPNRGVKLTTFAYRPINWQISKTCDKLRKIRKSETDGREDWELHGAEEADYGLCVVQDVITRTLPATEQKAMQMRLDGYSIREIQKKTGKGPGRGYWDWQKTADRMADAIK